MKIFPINGKDEFCYFAEEDGLIEKTPMYYRYFGYSNGDYYLVLNPAIDDIIARNGSIFKYPIILNFRGKKCGYFRTQEEAINFTKEGIRNNGD